MAETKKDFAYWKARALKKSKGRGAQVVKDLGSAAKDVAPAGLYGAGGKYVARMLADKIDFLKDNWYGEPLALAVGAVLMRRRAKGEKAAYGLMGAAGAIGALYYQLDQFQQGKTDKSPIPVFKRDGDEAAPAVGAGAGGGEAAYLQTPMDDPDSAGLDAGYLQTPDEDDEIETEGW